MCKHWTKQHNLSSQGAMGVPNEPRPGNDSATADTTSDSSTAPAETFVVKMMTEPEKNTSGDVNNDGVDENANIPDITLRKNAHELTDSTEDDIFKSTLQIRDLSATTDEVPNTNDVKDADDVDIAISAAFDTGLALEDGDDNIGEEGATRDEEEAEENKEMTPEEKSAMREAVKKGDINLLEDLLDKPNADIRMVYENLLMTAIREGQIEMAEFLLDNGVDHNFITKMVQQKDNPNKKGHILEWYEYSCRQMAYDRKLFDLVEMIDKLDGRLFPGVKPRQRVPRLRRPPRPFSMATSYLSLESENRSLSSSVAEADVSDQGDDDSWDRSDWSPLAGRQNLVSSTVKRNSSVTAGSPLTGEDRDSDLDEGVNNQGRQSGDSNRPSKEISSKIKVAYPSSITDHLQMKQRRKRRKKVTPESTCKTSLAFDGVKQEERRTSGSMDSWVVRPVTDVTATYMSEEIQNQQPEGASVAVTDEDKEMVSLCPVQSDVESKNENQQSLRNGVPTIHIKPTRAYLALRQATKTHLDQLLPARYEEAHPLRWRKVKSAGSYHTESQLWHHHISSQLSPQFTTSSTETGFSALSMLATIPLRTDTSGAEVHAGYKSSSDEPLGDVYASKPKILHPSQRMAPVSPPTTLIAAGNSSDSTSTNGSSSLSLASSVNASKLYPLRQKVPCPSYMSLTTSSNAKRKLRPSFTSSYNSLEFVRSGPKNAARLRDQLSSRTSKASSVSNLAQLSESSCMGMAPKVAENTSSAVDLAYISSAEDLTNMRPRSKTFTVGNGKNSFELRVNLKRHNTSEPNIRNKSAIIHTPKWVSPRATKAR